MSLAERRWLRLFTLCVLYVAQGIPWGFMATALPSYIKSSGNVGNDVVASALAMTTLPYTFKWIWGPIMDFVTIPRLGRRRPWIVFAQGMMAVTVIVIVAIPDVTSPASLDTLAWMILIHTVFNSMQDVAVDALAVDLLADDERGRANGLMYACKYAGGAIGGAGMGRVIAAYDLPTALIVQTSILVAIMLVPLLVRERSGAPPAPSKPREIAAGLAQVANLRTTFVVAILVLVLNVGLGVLYVAAFGLYIDKLGWKYADYTDLTGGLQLFVGLGGSIAGGFLADALGRRRVIAGAAIGLGGGWLVFATSEPLWTNDTFIYALAIWETACSSVMVVATIALCMEVSSPRVGATQFTSYMALSNLSTTIGYKLGGHATEVLSYAELYAVVGGAQIGLTALLLVVDPREARSRLPLPAGWRFGPYGILTALVFVAAVAVVPILLIF